MTSIPIVALIAFIGVAYLYESTKKPAGATSQLPVNVAALQAQQVKGAAIVNNPKIVPPQPSPITASFLQALVNKIATPQPASQSSQGKQSGSGSSTSAIPSSGGFSAKGSNTDQTSNDTTLNVPTDNSKVDAAGNLVDNNGNLIGVSSSGVPVEIAGGASAADEAAIEANAISPVDNAELSAALQPQDSNVTLDTGNSDLGVDPLTGELIDNNSTVDTTSNDSYSNDFYLAESTGGGDYNSGFDGIWSGNYGG